MASSPAPQPAMLRDMVVVGASAGGLSALRAIASKLPKGFPAAVLIVLHTGAHPSRLPEILADIGPNPARQAIDGDPLQPGRLVVAAPDHHLVIRDGAIRTIRGPKEHHTRPAIDPLFRSAALWAGTGVVGVLLSGRNDDGTAGLQAIKSCGGMAIVQDPDDAEEGTMPASALRQVDVDHRLPAERIAAVLKDVVGQPVPPPAHPPAWLVREHGAMLDEEEPVDNLAAIGEPTTLVCPDCHGTLFALSGAPASRYRCYTGHAFGLRSLCHTQAEAAEGALWSALRALREKETILRKVAELDRIAGDAPHAQESEKQAERISGHIDILRRLIDEA